MYVYIHIYMDVNMYRCVYAMGTNVYICIYIHICMDVTMYRRMYVYTYINLYIHVFKDVNMYTCIYVYMYIRIYEIYILHMHAHTSHKQVPNAAFFENHWH